MVVCYRLAGMTYHLAKWLRLVKSRFFSLPNILAGEALVPELLQHEVTGLRIAEEGRKKRAEATSQLEHLETELRETLISASARANRGSVTPGD